MTGGNAVGCMIPMLTALSARMKRSGYITWTALKMRCGISVYKSRKLTAHLALKDGSRTYVFKEMTSKK